MKTHDFKEVVKNYKAVFFDAFGVLKNHKGLISGVENTFSYLEEQGIDYYILTNDASRSPEKLAQWYREQNIPQITVDRIISSGMLAKDWLKLKIKSGRIAYLGTQQSAHYLRHIGLETISTHDLDLDDIDDIKCLVFLDDEGFDWNNDINKVINLLRKKTMNVIVANTDVRYPTSRTDIAVAVGGLANMVEKILSRQFIRFGKPDAQMFMFGYERANKKQELSRDEILMVGDTLSTDIIGGNKFGMDTVLVLSGNTLPDNAKTKIKSQGIIPTYICDSIGISEIPL